MPEIGEVARVVHFIRQHLVGKTLAVVKAQHDENVYGKVGTSAAEFEKAMSGKKIVGAGQQGKYFWLTMSSPPHPVLHFGMAGWFEIRHHPTAYYKRSAPKNVSDDWPPKYWKFTLETKPEGGSEAVEAAFIDFRRFARIRLVDCTADELRKTSPLKENGPDPVIDKDFVTAEWLGEKCGAKKIPIKALLLDQANISGIGNWVGDELLYHAKIHPEQYCNTLSATQIKQLHTSLHYVCGLAVDVLSDSSKFPEEWLFKHRWGKGKKDSLNRLPNGEKIVFLTVGGRTSAVVPTVQKKTGPVAGDVKAAKTNGKAGAKRKRAVKQEEEDSEEESLALEDDEKSEEEVKPTPKSRTPRSKAAVKKEETEEIPRPAKAARKSTAKTANGFSAESKANGKKAGGAGTKTSKTSKTAPAPLDKKIDIGRRRSGRLSG